MSSCSPKVIFFYLVSACSHVFSFCLPTVDILTLSVIWSCVFLLFYGLFVSFCDCSCLDDSHNKITQSRPSLNWIHSLSAIVRVTVRTFFMIHYSLVCLLFFCDRESARLGIYGRMELRKKKKETVSYFRITDLELKQNEIFTLSSQYPKTILPILIMFYFGGTQFCRRSCLYIYPCKRACRCVCVYVWGITRCDRHSVNDDGSIRLTVTHSTMLYVYLCSL